MSFNLDDFVSACREAATASTPHLAVRELMQQTVSDPAAISSALAQPEKFDQVGDMLIGHDRVVFEDESVTVFLVDTVPGHLQPPHDHQMMAVIGVYEGIENNRFFVRDATTDEGPGLKQISVTSVEPGDVLPIGPDTIHAIGAEGPELCRALHVYLGALSSVSRSLFDPRTGLEEPLDEARYNSLIVPA